MSRNVTKITYNEFVRKKLYNNNLIFLIIIYVELVLNDVRKYLFFILGSIDDNIYELINSE